MKQVIRIGNRNFGLVKCLMCGAKRYRRMFYVLKFKQHFCSRLCVIKARRAGLYGNPLSEMWVRCSICDLKIKRKPCEASKTGRYFCSNRCLSHGIKQRLIPINPIKSHTAKAGRQRARYLYSEDAPCEMCGNPNSERHHKDKNPDNNHPSNIARLCRKHHVHVGHIDHIRKIQPCGVRASIAVAVRKSNGRFDNHPSTKEQSLRVLEIAKEAA